MISTLIILRHVNTNDVIDGLVTDAHVKTTKAQVMNGSEEFILIDSSLDDECINEIGEPVIKPSRREARNKKTADEDTTHDKNKSDVHNDGSNVSTSSMSSRSSDIQDAADLACLPNEAKETDNVTDANNRFENESTSASMRLSLSASEDEAEEPSLCLNNLFDEKSITTKEPVASFTQENKEGDQEVSNLNIVNDEEDHTESRDESDSQSVDSLDRPNTLKRKRSPDDDVDEAQETDHQQELDESSMAKSSCKKTRLDESASQQSKSYLGKCIIL